MMTLMFRPACFLQVPLRLTLASNDVTVHRVPEPLYVSRTPRTDSFTGDEDHSHFQAMNTV